MSRVKEAVRTAAGRRANTKCVECKEPLYRKPVLLKPGAKFRCGTCSGVPKKAKTRKASTRRVERKAARRATPVTRPRRAATEKVERVQRSRVAKVVEQVRLASTSLKPRGTGLVEAAFDQKTLAAALDAVCRASSKRSSVQVLTGVHIAASKTEVTLTCTDLQTSITATAPLRAIGGGKSWSAVGLTAVKVRDAVRQFGPGEIGVALDGGTLVVWRGSKVVKLPTEPTNDWPTPAVTDSEVAVVSSASFLGCWEKVKAAISRDESRPVLCCALVDIAKSGLRMVATDSYRLAHALDGTLPKTPFTRNVWGPALTEVARIAKQSETLTVSSGASNWLEFAAGQVTVRTRCLDGTYPQYAQLRPDYGNDKIVLPREHALEAVRSIVKQSGARYPLTALAIDTAKSKPKVTLSHVTPDSSIEEPLDGVEVAGVDGGMTLGVNSDFLRDALASFDCDTVTMQLASPLRPMLFSNGSPDEHWHLLMPIRLPA